MLVLCLSGILWQLTIISGSIVVEYDGRLGGCGRLEGRWDEIVEIELSCYFEFIDI